HVGLVDDVDLVARLCGAEGGPLAQVTRVLHATVAGRVDLDHVNRAGSSAGQGHARLADAARLGSRPLLAVQAAGPDAVAGDHAADARNAELVRVVATARAQRVHLRYGDVLLFYDIGEGLLQVAAVKRGAHGETLSGGPVSGGVTHTTPRPSPRPGLP